MSERDRAKIISSKVDSPVTTPGQIEAIRAVLEKGEKDIRAGRIFTQRQARQRMARWLGR